MANALDIGEARIGRGHRQHVGGRRELQRREIGRRMNRLDPGDLGAVWASTIVASFFPSQIAVGRSPPICAEVTMKWTLCG